MTVLMEAIDDFSSKIIACILPPIIRKQNPRVTTYTDQHPFNIFIVKRKSGRGILSSGCSLFMTWHGRSPTVGWIYGFPGLDYFFILMLILLAIA